MHKLQVTTFSLSFLIHLTLRFLDRPLLKKIPEAQNEFPNQSLRPNLVAISTSPRNWSVFQSGQRSLLRESVSIPSKKYKVLCMIRPLFFLYGKSPVPAIILSFAKHFLVPPFLYENFPFYKTPWEPPLLDGILQNS